MYRLLHLLRTSIGQKLLMAVSGLVLVAFVGGHMIGNLKVFQGPGTLNDYAAWLQGHPLLWGIRLFMLAVVIAHIAMAVRLVLGNREARPRAYAIRVYGYTGIAARTMAISGVLIGVFLVFHLLHLTVGMVQPDLAVLVDKAGQVDVYRRVVLGLDVPWVAGVYIVSVLLVGLHLQHAVASLVRTLGFSNAHFHHTIDTAGTVITVLVTLGFLAIPVGVLTGLLTAPRA